MPKYGLMLCNMNHMLTYEPVLGVIDPTSIYETILRNMNYISTHGIKLSSINHGLT